MQKSNINQEKVRKIIEILKTEYPNAKTALHFTSPFTLLIATILSAQCTDERVNKVSSVLFKKCSTPSDFVKISLEELEKLISSVNFYKSKAKNIKALSATLIEKYNGEVPSNMEELVKLPGVARKTANVVLGNAFGKNEGIVVDTHVARVSNRIGLSNNTDRYKIELDLMAIVPRDSWTLFGNLLILHGRNVCKARAPLCEVCKINNLCEKNL